MTTLRRRRAVELMKGANKATLSSVGGGVGGCAADISELVGTQALPGHLHRRRGHQVPTPGPGYSAPSVDLVGMVVDDIGSA